jgi:hypothetical protein
MNKFIAWILARLGLRDEIEDIVKPIVKISKRLEDHAVKQMSLAAQADLVAAQKAAEAAERTEKARVASQLAAAYRPLGNITQG